MKRNFSFFIGVILTTTLAVQFVSCNNKEQEETGFDSSVSGKALQEYASIHNSGLEYIKSDMEKTSGAYTKNRLDSTFREFVIYQYGKDIAGEILREVNPMKELVFNGTIPSLQQTRNGNIEGFTNQTNAFAQEALNECMTKIANHLNSTHENEIFDNTPLLDDLHVIINETYTAYTRKCISDIDAEALAHTFGVLYGSMEYWTNSNNVESWSKINMEENDETSLGTTFNKVIKKEDKKKKDDKKKDKEKKEEQKQDDRTLTKSQWVQTVAAADALGAALGSGAASGPAAIASSAAAALYFNVR